MPREHMSSVRDLYQCCGLAPLDFLDFLYGDAQVIYEEMETDGNLEDDTGSDEIRSGKTPLSGHFTFDRYHILKCPERRRL